MKARGHPVSPHVTIYAFPVAALSSITNRVTGCIISFGCLGLGAAELVGGGGTSLFILQWIGSQGPLIAASAKFTVAFPVVYHYLGALRHLYWDAVPDSLTNDQVAKASYYLFGATTVISAGAMLV
jgi:succinate dehydrogenase (ubiquinone) cytochrome b560 subunit